MVERAGLNQHDRRALLRANACASLAGHRHQAHWQNLAIESTQVLYAGTAANNGSNANSNTLSIPRSAEAPTRQPDTASTLPDLDDGIALPGPSEMQDIRADYSYTGLTLKRHPMRILRQQAPFNRCSRCIDLAQLGHKRFAVVAGIVTGRQRPGTASGVIFLTLEDETGNINVVVWRNRQQQYREVLLKSKLLLVKGIVEKNASVIHIIAGQLVDCSDALQGYLLPSRDFH
ncbi:MAG: hypothetical protein KJO24_00570 [Gammaproteobacteria bacterium]|nr:hypothetical protein [Gammaproteobacteria bacterium]